MTNYDRIKSMSLDEKAEYLGTKWGCDTCAFGEHPLVCIYETKQDCIDGHKKWLEGGGGE